MRTNHFWANDALFLTGLMAYNLLNCIRRLALPNRLRTARIKRIGFSLLHMPANVIGRSRQIWAKIKHDHPFRLIFYQAMHAIGLNRNATRLKNDRELRSEDEEKQPHFDRKNVFHSTDFPFNC